MEPEQFPPAFASVRGYRLPLLALPRSRVLAWSECCPPNAPKRSVSCRAVRASNQTRSPPVPIWSRWAMDSDSDPGWSPLLPDSSPRHLHSRYWPEPDSRLPRGLLAGRHPDQEAGSKPSGLERSVPASALQQTQDPAPQARPAPAPATRRPELSTLPNSQRHLRSQACRQAFPPSQGLYRDQETPPRA